MENRYEWAKEAPEVVINDGLEFNNFGSIIYVIDKETGILYTGIASEGTGELAADVKYFVEGSL